MNYANKKTNDLARRQLSTITSAQPLSAAPLLLQPGSSDHEDDGGKSRWKRRQNIRRGAILGVSTCLVALVFWIRPFSVIEEGGVHQSSSAKEEASRQACAPLLSVHNGTQDSHIVLTVAGQKGGTVNQDRSTVWPCRQESNDQHVFVAAALFDGHGPKGHDCAQRSLQVVPPIVEESMMGVSTLSEEVLHKAVRKAFAQADKSMRECETSGTTALLLLLRVHGITKYATLASAGDSTGLVVEAKFVKDLEGNVVNVRYRSIAESIKHKAAIPGERKRIEEAGGVVWMPENDNHTANSRVLYPIEGGQGEMSLAMSRSIGDLDGKRFGVLTSEPSLATVEVNYPTSLMVRSDETGTISWFAILASDGVFDVLDKEHVMWSVGRYIEDPVALDVACRALLEEAKRAWFKWTGGTYRDDMTLLVTTLAKRVS